MSKLGVVKNAPDLVSGEGSDLSMFVQRCVLHRVRVA